jgi:hypothetical protein
VLGSEGQQIKWNQAADALHVQLPRQTRAANDFGAAIKIALS